MIGGIFIFKKFDIDKKYLKIAVYVFTVIAFSIILEKVLSHASYLMQSTASVFVTIKKLISPFIYGFFIAYLISPIVSFFEQNIFGTIKIKSRTKRVFSILLTYIIAIGCLVWLLTYFIPEIIATLSNFFILLPDNIADFEVTVTKFFNENNFIKINSEDVVGFFNTLFAPIIGNTQDISIMLQKILNSTVIAASTLLNAIMGIFIGFYMLSDKEHFRDETKKILYTFFDEKKTDYFLYNTNRVHTIFQSFIIGKTIDSTIIGLICFVGMYLIRVPYATIISLIIGITNMIPYFGPFIGAVPAILMTLLIEPSKAIWVAIFILALQQFDGILLGPKILGNSTGVSPIWIILAIIVGGAVMGPLGMFLGVPVFASFKLFFTEYIDKNYTEKYFYNHSSSKESSNKEKHK